MAATREGWFGAKRGLISSYDEILMGRVDENLEISHTGLILWAS